MKGAPAGASFLRIVAGRNGPASGLFFGSSGQKPLASTETSAKTTKKDQLRSTWRGEPTLTSIHPTNYQGGINQGQSSAGPLAKVTHLQRTTKEPAPNSPTRPPFSSLFCLDGCLPKTERETSGTSLGTSLAWPLTPTTGRISHN